MIQKLFSILIFPFCSLSILAQNDSAFMELPVRLYDFGTVYQADGEVELKITVVNSGEATLKINRILTSGLTVKGFPKEGILPGKKREVVLSFNPSMEYGNFQKKITLFSNAENSPQFFYTKGIILSGSITKSFNFKIGGVAFKQSQLNFGYIYKGEQYTRYFPLMNLSDEFLTVQFSNIPDYIQILPNFDTLLPREQGILEVTYNTTLCEEWDFIMDKVDLTVLGTDVVKGKISLASNIRENFDSIASLDRSYHPIAKIPIKVYNFDTISNSDVVNYSYLLINAGSKELSIRAIKPTCGCTAALSETNVVAPGDSTYINLEFDAEGYAGFTKQGVTVITNDPVNYKQFLWIAGIVGPNKKELP